MPPISPAQIVALQKNPDQIRNVSDHQCISVLC